MDEIQHLRGEIAELKVQRQDYRELKNFHLAEAIKWKEEAERASAETSQVSERLEKSREVARALEEDLQVARNEKKKAEEESQRFARLHQLTNATWKATAGKLESENERLRAQLRQKDARIDGYAQQSKTSSIATTGLQEQLQKATSEVDILQERIREAESCLQVAESGMEQYRLDHDKLEKELEIVRRRAEDAEATIGESPRKRRRKTTIGPSTSRIGLEEALDLETVQKMRKAFMAVYHAVTNCKAPDGRIRCEAFRKLPNKETHPGYHRAITQPVSLYHIQQRVNSGVFYRSVETFRKDFHRMFYNATKYYGVGSQEAIDADELENTFITSFVANFYDTDLPGAAQYLSLVPKSVVGQQ